MATDFQKLVWAEIDKIPYGSTITYKEIAIKIGKPRAARAVANACGKNPEPIIRPCHRVICSNGDIGGYSGLGGIKAKKKLLQQESS
tara:strand:- start:758 stop:1018 length:261 start_codon:yes stop_codon:yes gene_type:complete